MKAKSGASKTVQFTMRQAPDQALREVNQAVALT